MKDLQLIKYTSDYNKDMIVNIEPNNEIIDGSKNLIQRIIKRIFTVQGSNAYNPNIGGQFNALFTAVTVEEAEEIKETFAILLDPVVQQLKEEQVAYLNVLKADEILKDIILDSVTYDPIFGGFLVNLTVKTEGNSTFTLTV